MKYFSLIAVMTTLLMGCEQQQTRVPTSADFLQAGQLTQKRFSGGAFVPEVQKPIQRVASNQ